jgi:hypothetical protein
VEEMYYKAAEYLYEQFATKAKDLKIHEEGQAAETESAPESRE